MAKLVFLLDGNVVKETVLDKERISIGRRASNDVHIDNLSISGEHAVVVTTTDGSYIEDLNSTNGTIVNKVKVKKHLFADGDLIRLGKYKLRYLQDDTIHKSRNDGFESTILVVDTAEAVEGESQATPAKVTPEKIQQPAVKPAEKPTQKATKQQKPPRLTILNGDDVGSTLLLDKAIVKIGQPNKQLALVTRRSEGYFISHVVGDDDLLVNGKPIDVRTQALRDHDEIEMLGIKMEFCLD